MASAALSELASVPWRPVIDAERLRRWGRLWTLWTVGWTIPFIAAECCGVLTHTVPTAAYRGAGRPEATYAIERLIDVGHHL